MSPCGWPGRALLLLRLGVVAILTQDGILSWMGALQRKPISLHIVAASAGVFLLLGLWTPVAGAIVALSDMDGSHRLCSPAVHHPPRNARHRSRISGTGLSVHRRLHVWQKAYQYLEFPRATFLPLQRRDRTQTCREYAQWRLFHIPTQTKVEPISPQ